MKRTLIVLGIQLVVLLGWAGQNEWVRAHAATFRVPLRPADPYDVIRGRYFRVNLRDAFLETGEPDVLLDEAAARALVGPENRYGGPVLVGFCPQGSLERVCALAPIGADPSGGPARYWSRADARIVWRTRVLRDGDLVGALGYDVTLDFGLDRFFIPNRLQLPARENDPGWSLEVCHRPGLAPLARRLWFREQVVAE